MGFRELHRESIRLDSNTSSLGSFVYSGALTKRMNAGSFEMKLESNK